VSTFGSGECLILQIRDASWSVFEALPGITSLGVAAVNGLSAVYVRGSTNEAESYKGTLLLFSNQTTTNPTYYREVVSETTGDPVGLPSIFDFGIPLQNMPWFQEALTMPVKNLTWTIGQSQISKLYTHIYSEFMYFFDLIWRDGGNTGSAFSQIEMCSSLFCCWS
jgi:hypothetical protein